MKSPEKIKKIEAVVLYILQFFKDGVDYIKLFKIMYFAQQEYLATYGLTLDDDNFKCRLKGPVPALTYKVVKMVENGASFAETPDLKSFADAISIGADQIIHAKKKPNMDYIADMEKDQLDKTIAKYRDMSSEDLSKLSHDSAYKAAKRRMRLDPQKDMLTLIEIAKAGGADKDMLDHIRDVQIIRASLEY